MDLDPQASAASWGDQRSVERPVVAAVPSARLDDALRTAAAHGAQLAIIDTAPHSERASLAAAKAADLALIPLRPGVLDLRALSTTIDICTLAAVAAWVVLNQVPPRGQLPEEAAAAIAGQGIALAPCRVGSRIAFVHALTAGAGAIEHDPRGKAAQEITALSKWLRRELQKTTRER